MATQHHTSGWLGTGRWARVNDCCWYELYRQRDIAALCFNAFTLGTAGTRN